MGRMPDGPGECVATAPRLKSAVSSTDVIEIPEMASAPDGVKLDWLHRIGERSESVVGWTAQTEDDDAGDED
jgi:hypothetical protein